jgi:hypothetical protein
VATDDVEDLDLDELDDELTGQLDDEDLDPRERHTLAEIRAALRRTKGKLERAFDDGKTAGRDEAQREQAWEAAGIPARVRDLMGDVDPRDRDALAAKVAELQADGLSWGGSPDPTAQRAAEHAAERTRSATLGRMATAAAAGQQVTDPEGDKAAAIKRRIDAGQPVSDDEAAWFTSYVTQVAAAMGAAQGKGF